MSDDNIVEFVQPTEVEEEVMDTFEGIVARAADAGLKDIIIMGFGEDGDMGYVTNIETTGE